jgi:D-sedoheptulose 7-phosphate isomerase
VASVIGGPAEVSPELSLLEEEARDYLEATAAYARDAATGRLPAEVARAGAVLVEVLQGGGKVLFCGNGGSAADAQHLAAELVGRMAAGRERPPLAGIALTTDTSALTALANDFGFEEVFVRQIEAIGLPGDVLVALSTSGRSPNVVRAADAARARSIRVIALVGPDLCPLDDLAEVCLHLPGTGSGFVQQGHIAVGHLLCGIAESAVRPG